MGWPLVPIGGRKGGNWQKAKLVASPTKPQGGGRGPPLPHVIATNGGKVKIGTGGKEEEGQDIFRGSWGGKYPHKRIETNISMGNKNNLELLYQIAILFQFHFHFSF
jgi:hypothetical protein